MHAYSLPLPNHSPQYFEGPPTPLAIPKGYKDTNYKTKIRIEISSYNVCCITMCQIVTHIRTNNTLCILSPI